MKIRLKSSPTSRSGRKRFRDIRNMSFDMWQLTHINNWEKVFIDISRKEEEGKNEI